MFEFFDSSVKNHGLDLVKWIKPTLRMAVAILVDPFNTGTVEHTPMVLKESLGQGADMLAKHISRHPTLVEFRHRLANLCHYLRSQLLIHDYFVLVMLTAQAS